MLEQASCDRRDAEILMLSVCGAVDRGWLFAHRDDCLDATQIGQFLDLCDRRRSGTPIAYLVGRREFWSLELEVTPSVLIPRPETELLVEWAVELIDRHSLDSILDLGTGSGAIALAIKTECPDLSVMATDNSEAALSVARRNAAKHGLKVNFHLSNWYASIPDETGISIIVSNPPYVAIDDPHLLSGDLPAEPQEALTDNGNGFAALEQVISGATARLQPGGWLLVEHGYEQSDKVCEMLVDAGFEAVETRRDLSHLPRVSGGRRS